MEPIMNSKAADFYRAYVELRGLLSKVVKCQTDLENAQEKAENPAERRHVENVHGLTQSALDTLKEAIKKLEQIMPDECYADGKDWVPAKEGDFAFNPAVDEIIGKGFVARIVTPWGNAYGLWKYPKLSPNNPEYNKELLERKPLITDMFPKETIEAIMEKATLAGVNPHEIMLILEKQICVAKFPERPY